MIPDKENLIKILKDSAQYIHKNFKSECDDIDHASFQTVGEDEYKDLFEKIGKDNNLIKEIHYSGRNMAVFELKEPIEIDDRFTLKRIEIEAPKPGSEIKESYWESVSYKVNNLDEAIDKNKNTDNELRKVRQVENDKYGYIMLDEYRIQLRNNFFCVDTKEDNNKSSDEDNFQKMYEEEKEKRLKVLADMDNEKKRLERQKQEFIKLANVAIVKDLFDIVDDLNRAVKEESDRKSIEMIFNKLLGVLNNYGVVPLKAEEGDKFDPVTMEAISTLDGDDKNKNKVIHVEQIGFKHKEDDRILRPCRVIVGK